MILWLFVSKMSIVSVELFMMDGRVERFKYENYSNIATLRRW